jgi:hypothetical protein
MGETNFGTLIKKEIGAVYTVIGEVVNIEPPEYLAEAIESTNHSSGGDKEFISGGLRELGEFKATINFDKAVISGFYNDIKAGTVGKYSIDFPDTGSTKWKFDALVISLKPSAADAQSPEALQAEVGFQPTGGLTLE